MLSATDIFKKINSVSKKTKIPVYVVGGFVRDYLMNVEQKKDLDFVVVGSGLTFAREFDKELSKKMALPRRSSAGAKAGSLVEFSEFDTARYVIVRSAKGGSASGGKVESPVTDDAAGEIVLEFAGARSEKYKKNSRKPAVVPATLEEDLSRRDFTVNAMAIDVSKLSSRGVPKGRRGDPVGLLRFARNDIVDPYNGQKDLENKILRSPLPPDQTFSDDPLRMMRAVRFAAQLEFCIEKKTLESIYQNRDRLKIISAERIKEELFKILACPTPSIGLGLMFHTHLLDLVLPEVAKLDGVEEIYGHQHKNNLAHTFKVVDNIAERSEKALLRLAGLLHDIGKAPTKKFVPKIGWTFYQHEHVGKKLVFALGRRLRFSKAETDYLAKLVRWHQQPISLMDEGITDSAVRRLVVNLGEELDDLLILGRSDITTGNPFKKEKRLKNYDRLEKRIAEVLEKDKLRAFQSPVRGEEIMKLCGLKPGPTVGRIKEAIEEAILDGKIPNEYNAAKKYFAEIKDKFLVQAQEWERVKR